MVAMLDSTVGGRIGDTHAALVKMEREQNEMAARLKKLEAMDRKQAKTGGSKDAVSAVVTSLTGRLDSIADRHQALLIKLTSGDTSIAAPASAAAIEHTEAADLARLGSYLQWLRTIERLDAEIGAKAATDGQKIEAFRQLARLAQALSGSGCRNLHTHALRSCERWKGSLASERIEAFVAAVKPMRGLYAPVKAEIGDKQLNEFDAALDGVLVFDTYTYPEAGAAEGTADMAMPVKLLLEQVAARFRYHHCQTEGRVVKIAGTVRHADDHMLGRRYAGIEADTQVWVDGHADILERIARRMATAGGDDSGSGSGGGDGASSAVRATRRAFAAGISALIAELVREDLAVLLTPPVTMEAAFRLCELARACVQIDRRMSHMRLAGVPGCWAAFAAHDAAVATWLAAEHEVMRDKLESILDDPAAWSAGSPELSRLDPVRATKATDAVLTMAGTVKALVGLLPDPDVRFTLVESLVSVLAGFRMAVQEAAEAAMGGSSGPKLAGNLGVMLNACWYVGRSLSVLLDDPVFVDAPDPVAGGVCIDEACTDESCKGIDGLLGTEIEELSQLERALRLKMIGAVSAPFKSYIDEYYMLHIQMDDLAGDSEVHRIFAQALSSLGGMLTAMTACMGDDLMQEHLGAIATELCKFLVNEVVLKTSTVTELMAQQLRRDVDDGLIKGCFAAFTNTPQALFVEISEVVSLINLDAARWSRLHGLLRMGESLRKDQTMALHEAGVFQMEPDDARRALELRQDLLRAAAPAPPE